MKRLAALIIFTFGVLTGAVLLRLSIPAPAIAQTTPPSPSTSQSATPMQSQMPMPMHGMMMHMMNPKSAADRAYMGAMMQMHGGMMRMTMTGNADHDFLAMMIPHHQAAVAMAETELQYGRDAKVKALAKRIIAAQQAEISTMRSWLK